jgi:hypothetical protein
MRAACKTRQIRAGLPSRSDDGDSMRQALSLLYAPKHPDSGEPLFSVEVAALASLVAALL